MIIGCADLDSFFDRELAAEHAAEFRDHLAGCARCARVLRGRMQEAMVADAAPDVRLPDELGHRRPRPRVALVAGALASLLGAAAVVLAVRAAHREAPRARPLEVALTVEPSGPVARGDTAHPGDHLHVLARGARYRAIWVYKDARALVASCPAPRVIDPPAVPRGPVCRVDGDALALTFALPGRGAYAVVTLGGASSLPTPTGALDADLVAASSIDGSYQIGHFDVD
jgi:Putative zinc-finger